jgi:hypothetical protein
MTRITKREAQKRFNEGELVVLCPRKMRPEGPFSMGVSVAKKDYENNWGADPWERMYNNWSFYNSSYETGYYPHYYLP